MGMRQVEHLGCEKHDPVGPAADNHANRTRGKTVLAELGPVEVDVPETGPHVRAGSRLIASTFSRSQLGHSTNPSPSDRNDGTEVTQSWALVQEKHDDHRDVCHDVPPV